MNHFRIIGTKSKNDGRSTSELFLAGKGLVEKKQTEEAIPYLEAAAKEKYLPAIITMYEIYKNGIGLDVNLTKAFEVIKKYESYNEPQLYLLIGRAYELGEGTNSSYPQAAKYYEAGAKLEFPPCVLALKEIRGY